MKLKRGCAIASHYSHSRVVGSEFSLVFSLESSGWKRRRAADATRPTVAWQRVARYEVRRLGAGPSSVEVRAPLTKGPTLLPLILPYHSLPYPQALRKVHTGCLFRSASDTCCGSHQLPLSRLSSPYRCSPLSMRPSAPYSSPFVPSFVVI